MPGRRISQYTASTTGGNLEQDYYEHFLSVNEEVVTLEGTLILKVQRVLKQDA